MNDKEFKKYTKILKKSYVEHLEKEQVKFPSGIKLYELCYLYKNFKKPLAISEISNAVQKKYPNKDGKQARHLAGSGWYLKTGTKSATIFKYDENFDAIILTRIYRCPNHVCSWNNFVPCYYTWFFCVYR